MALQGRTSGFDSRKAKAGIIRSPMPIRAAKYGLEQCRNFIEKGLALLTRQRGAERIGEYVEPPAHARGQRRGARNQFDTPGHESRTAQTQFILFDGRKVPRNPRSGIFDASALQRSHERDGNRGDVPMAAQFAYESSSSLESAESTCNRGIRIVLDPMQDSIGKDGIELVLQTPARGRPLLWRQGRADGQQRSCPENYQCQPPAPPSQRVSPSVRRRRNPDQGCARQTGAGAIPTRVGRAQARNEHDRHS